MFPDYDATWLEREFDTISTRKGDPCLLGDEDKVRLKGCTDYWHDRKFAAIADALTPDEVKQAEQNTLTGSASSNRDASGPRSAVGLRPIRDQSRTYSFP